MLIDGTILDARFIEPVCGKGLLSSKTRQLFDWWNRHSQGGIPRRSSFDVTAHRQLIGHLFLVEVIDRTSFRTKIVGDQASRMVERSREGTLLRTDAPDPVLRCLARYYQAVLDRRRPLACTGTIQYADKGVRRFEGIDCRLSRDGSGITALLGVMDFV